MLELWIPRVTLAIGGLWLGLFVYQAICAAVLAVRWGIPELGVARALGGRLLRSAFLFLLCSTLALAARAPGRWTAWIDSWAGRVMLLALVVAGLRFQLRTWNVVLALGRDRALLLPWTFWLLAAAGMIAVVAGGRVELALPPISELARLVRPQSREHWPLLFLLASFAGATALVLVVRYDERLRWSSDEQRFLHPHRVRALSTAKLGIALAMGSLLSAAVCIFVWNRLAVARGAVPIPDLYPELPAVYFRLAIAWQAPIVAALLLRGLRRPLFDCFVSYKSEDVQLARRVTDQLMAAGSRVWFAEYQILLRRRRFAAALRSGLRRSAWGIAFTNDRYVDSEWCRQEIESLIHRLGPGRLVEVQIPLQDEPRRRYPELASSPAIESRDVGEILRFVRAETGMPANPAEAVPSGERKLYEGTYLGRPLTLEVSGWVLHEKPREGEIGGITFRFTDAPALFVNVWAHPETSPAGQRAARAIDDRQMFDSLVRFARDHLRRLPVHDVRARGVHLLFHSGLSQIALTYHMGFYWTRKVSLVIPNRSTGQMAEFEFTFGFRGPFTEYCRHAFLMDSLALSLAWT